MTTPERIQTKYHRQIFDDRTDEHLEPERETAWVDDFIERLTGMLRSMGGKSKK